MEREKSFMAWIYHICLREYLPSSSILDRQQLWWFLQKVETNLKILYPQKVVYIDHVIICQYSIVIVVENISFLLGLPNQMF